MSRVLRLGGGIVVLELDPTGFWMRALVIAEKLLGEPGAFFTPSEMCEFFLKHGIEGECTPMGGPNYRFVGEARSAPDSAATSGV